MNNRLLTNVTPDTAAAILSWLGKHGKDIPLHIPLKTVKFARECFALIDTDKSGTLEPEELQQVFESLGQQVSLRQATALVESVAGRGAACLNFTQFAQMLNGALSGKDGGSEQALQQQLLQEAVNQGGGGEQDQQATFNWADFHLLAKAFRRRKIVSGVINNEEGWREKVLAMAERQQAARKRLGSAAALNWRQRTADSSGRQSAAPGSHQQGAQGRAAGLAGVLGGIGGLGREGIGGSLDGIVSAEATPRELLGPGVVVDDPEEQDRRRRQPAMGVSLPCGHKPHPHPQPARSRTAQPHASSSLPVDAATSSGAPSSPPATAHGSRSTAAAAVQAAAPAAATPAAADAGGPCISTRQHSAAALQAALSRLGTRSYQSILSLGPPQHAAPAPADLAAAAPSRGASIGGFSSSSSSSGSSTGGLSGGSGEMSAEGAGTKLPASPLGGGRTASSRAAFVAGGSRLGRSAATGGNCRFAGGSGSLSLGRLRSSISIAAGYGSAQVLAAAESGLGAELVEVKGGSKEADLAAVQEGRLPLSPGLAPVSLSVSVSARSPAAALAKAALTPPLPSTTGALLRPHTPSVFPPGSLGPTPDLGTDIVVATAAAAALASCEGAACSGAAAAAAAGASPAPQRRHVPHYMLPLGRGVKPAGAASGRSFRTPEPEHGSLEAEAAVAASSRPAVGASLQGPGAGSWRSGAANMDAIAASYRLRRQLVPGTPATAAAGSREQAAAAGALATTPPAAAAATAAGTGAAEAVSRPQGSSSSREGRSPRRAQGDAAVQSYLLEQVSAPAGHTVRRRAAAMQLIRLAQEQDC